MNIIRATLSGLLFAMLGACNTIEGAGQDIEAGGEAVSGTAREAERDLSQ